jgi:hypothetical protein
MKSSLGGKEDIHEELRRQGIIKLFLFFNDKKYFISK